MGANMVRRLIKHGHQCVVYDRSAETVSQLAGEGATGATSMDDFVKKLQKPRAVWLMVPAAVVDSTLHELSGKLEKGDIVINKRMASAFFETNLWSLFTFHGVDTVVVTGGSTSGCVRATVIDSLSRSFRTIVPEECVADKHESPHFANLYDMALKYADVIPVAEVIDFMSRYRPA